MPSALESIKNHLSAGDRNLFTPEEIGDKLRLKQLIREGGCQSWTADRIASVISDTVKVSLPRLDIPVPDFGLMQDGYYTTESPLELMKDWGELAAELFARKIIGARTYKSHWKIHAHNNFLQTKDELIKQYLSYRKINGSQTGDSNTKKTVVWEPDGEIQVTAEMICGSDHPPYRKFTIVYNPEYLQKIAYNMEHFQFWINPELELSWNTAHELFHVREAKLYPRRWQETAD